MRPASDVSVHSSGLCIGVWAGWANGIDNGLDKHEQGGVRDLTLPYGPCLIYVCDMYCPKVQEHHAQFVFLMIVTLKCPIRPT